MLCYLRFPHNFLIFMVGWQWKKLIAFENSCWLACAVYAIKFEIFWCPDCQMAYQQKKNNVIRSPRRFIHNWFYFIQLIFAAYFFFYSAYHKMNEVSCFWGSRDGAVVRALASHQCGPGSIPVLGVICELSLLLVLVLARGFFSGYSCFPPSSKN